jgi:hypothetical protein
VKAKREAAIEMLLAYADQQGNRDGVERLHRKYMRLLYRDAARTAQDAVMATATEDDGIEWAPRYRAAASLLLSNRRLP